MSFTDQAIVLGARAHGEAHALAELFTEAHGRWPALVHGGQGRRMLPLLQAGNEVRAEWKGRSDSLGFFTIELTKANAAALIDDGLSLAALQAATALARACLPDREPHAGAFRAMKVLIEHLDAFEIWPILMARWELGLLAELGFGLTLDRCAATGAREDLIYVSPRSACAVSREAGAPYTDKLLPLPQFLIKPGADASIGDALSALTTTGYFLETRILHLAGRQLPEARVKLIALLEERLRLREAPDRG
ncbi:MAG: DNA repair protein RecO [Parvularculaceae bacterium]|nr:DNA repair protein RecO [Parvularculaceae bacterium]